MARANTYIQTLAELLGGVTFDGALLSTTQIIRQHKRSSQDTANTIINIYSESLSSKFLETRLNRRTFSILILIRTLADNREEQAQIDLNDLEESVVEVLENNLKNAATSWTDGYLRTDGIMSKEMNFRDNYYTKAIPLDVVQWKPITV